MLQSKCAQELPTLTQIADEHSVMRRVRHPINLHLNPENPHEFASVDVVRQVASAASVEEEQSRWLESLKT